mmetsp:Transcript_7021/g.17039  ORF Transcript_7021/g.17039 Transcript_7021/m.17039 type:complete len:221 (+) Transcript_7021:867-1529(+)
MHSAAGTTASVKIHLSPQRFCRSVHFPAWVEFFQARFILHRFSSRQHPRQQASHSRTEHEALAAHAARVHQTGVISVFPHQRVPIRGVCVQPAPHPAHQDFFPAGRKQRQQPLRQLGEEVRSLVRVEPRDCRIRCVREHQLVAQVLVEVEARRPREIADVDHQRPNLLRTPTSSLLLLLLGVEHDWACHRGVVGVDDQGERVAERRHHLVAACAQAVYDF